MCKWHRRSVLGRHADGCCRYVIANNTIESPPNTPDIHANILNGILPKLPVDIITVEQAIAALNQSGPAAYGMGM